MCQGEYDKDVFYCAEYKELSASPKDLPREFKLLLWRKSLVKLVYIFVLHIIPLRGLINPGHIAKIPRFQLLAEEEGCVSILRQVKVPDAELTRMIKAALPVATSPQTALIASPPASFPRSASDAGFGCLFSLILRSAHPAQIYTVTDRNDDRRSYVDPVNKLIVRPEQ